MKRILILLFILMSTYINAQVIGADMLNREPKTTVQMNAITVAQGLKNGSEVLNSDTNTIWRYNGTIWEDTGGGLQASDIGVTVQGYNVNTDLDSTDDVTLTGNQTIAGQKTFTDKLFLGNALSDLNIFSIRYVSATPNLSSVQSGHGSLYFQNDGRFTVNNGNTTAQTATFDLSGLTQRRDYDLPDLSGTIALTSNIPDNTDFVDLTSDQTNITGNKIFDELRVLDNGIGSFSNALEVSVPGGLNQSTFPHFIVDVDENEPGSSKINFLIDIGVPTYRVLEATASDLTYNGTSLLSGGGSSPPFDDNSPHIRDNLDNTKTITIVADNITTATNRNLTMPDADVDLGNLGAANLDLAANYTWTGTHNFPNITEFNSTLKIIGNVTTKFGGLILYENNGTTQTGFLGYSGSSVRMSNVTSAQVLQLLDAGGADFNGNFTADTFIKDGATSDDVLLGNGTTTSLTNTLDAANHTITDAAGNFVSTDVEGALAENASDIADRPTSLGTGRTNAVQYSDVFGQTLADYNTDGAGGAGDLIIITDASPAEVVATATIAMDGWKMYDDQTADAATITLSDCDPGETLTVYINRASAPTLAGTGLTFNQLPNTTAFASATQMMIIFEVAYDGTTIDYYYVER